MKKRLLTFVLSLAMVVAMVPLLPAVVHAAGMPIEIDGIAPVAGETPVTIDDDFAYSPAEYNLIEMKWYANGQRFKGTFQPGKDYCVALTFKTATPPNEEEASIVIDGVTYASGDDDCIINVEGNTIIFECWFRDLPTNGFVIVPLGHPNNVIEAYNNENHVYRMKKYNGVGKVTYYWYNCDKNGNISGKAIYSNTTGKFTIKNLGYNKGLHYIAVRAKDADGDWSNKVVLKMKIYYALNDATIKVKDRTYNGKSGRQPEIVIKAKINGVNKTLKKGTDYKIDYKKDADKRKSVGEYKFSIAGKGYYFYNYPSASDEFDIVNVYDQSFKVNPKGTSVSSITPGSKKLTVKWKKQSAKMSKSRITGYQVQVATNKSFTAGKKTYKVKGYSKTAKTFKNLKGGKKYYVRVRTYKVVDGVTCYSNWSKVKVRTTKK